MAGNIYTLPTFLPPSHPNLYFANNAETFAASEDEGEHQVTVPESTNASIAGKIQLSKQTGKFQRK